MAIIAAPTRPYLRPFQGRHLQHSHTIVVESPHPEEELAPVGVAVVAESRMGSVDVGRRCQSWMPVSERQNVVNPRHSNPGRDAVGGPTYHSPP